MVLSETCSIQAIGTKDSSVSPIPEIVEKHLVGQNVDPVLVAWSPLHTDTQEVAEHFFVLQRLKGAKVAISHMGLGLDFNCRVVANQKVHLESRPRLPVSESFVAIAVVDPTTDLVVQPSFECISITSREIVYGLALKGRPRPLYRKSTTSS